MTNATATEKSAQDIWNEEVSLRETGTAQAATEVAQGFTQTDEAIATETAASTAPTETETSATQTEDGKTTVETGTESPQIDPAMQLLIDRFDKLETRQRNVEGHIGGLRTAHQQVLDSMEAARKATEAEAPTKQQVEQAAGSSEKWQTLKKEFPEWAEATEELLAAQLGKAKSPSFDPAELDRRVAESSTKLRQELIEETLEGLFPGWKEDVKTPQFKQWYDGADQATQELAQSSSLGDAARMLRLFNAAKEADPSEAIANNRKQKLENAIALPKTKHIPPAKTEDQLTDKELWDLEVRRREEAKRKQGL